MPFYSGHALYRRQSAQASFSLILLKTLMIFLIGVVALLQPSMLQAQEGRASSDWFFAGVAAESYTSPYLGDKTRVEPTLLFFYSGEHATIIGSEAYIYAFEYAGAKLLYRRDGAGSDNEDLKNASVRKDSLDGGIFFGRPGLTLSFVGDLTNTHKGSEAILEISPNFWAGNLLFNPNFSGTIKSGKMADYYYGVSEDQSKKSGFEEYELDEGTSFSAGLTMIWQFMPEWSLNFIAKQTLFSQSIKDSPIVERSSTSVVLGVAYHFIPLVPN